MAETKNDIVRSMIDYIGYSDAAMTKAAAVIQEREVQAEKLAALIPQAIKACIEHERIEAHEKAAFETALRDPVRTMELLIKLAGHRNAAEMARLGTPVGASTKTAGYDPANSVNSGYVGARTSQLKQSDLKLFQGLGLALPTS